MAERSVLRYWACLRKLSEFFNKSPETISPEELRRYFIHLKTEKKLARQTSTQTLCAIKLFWEKTARLPWPAELQFARANPRFKLPVVLSAQEVRKILGCVTALDHRVCLSAIYACGLRLSEGLNLEVRDVDSQRMLLHIRAGKGNRDRFVPLPERTLQLLRQQWKTHRHPKLLFPGKGHSGQGAATATEAIQAIQRSTLQRAFRLALKASGIKKAAHIHTLRHSYATHLLEQGENLRQIKRWDERLHSDASTDDRTATIERAADPGTFEKFWDKEWHDHVMKAAVEKVRAEFSATQFQMFDLNVLKEWPAGDIAKSLGVSRASVYLAKHRISAAAQKGDPATRTGELKLPQPERTARALSVIAHP